MVSVLTLNPKEAFMAGVKEKIDGSAPIVNPGLPELALTELNLMERFVEECGEKKERGFIFDHERDTWLRWNGHTWERDSTGAVRRAVDGFLRRMAVLAAEEPDMPTRQALLRRTATVQSCHVRDSIVTLARDHTYIPADERALWDADRRRLGAPNGAIELDTGRLSPGRKEERITRRVNVPYNPDATAPRWERFLSEVFPDPVLVEWIRLAVGYSLTGETGERCFFLCYGAGHNGKSTLFKHLRNILGDYGAEVNLQALEAGRFGGGDNATPSVMKFNGPRFITASETRVEGGKGARLDEALIKDLTGNDLVTGRALYGSLKSFLPSARLWIGVNHKPRVEDLTPAFWGRVKLIPFLEAFEGERVDPALDEDLRAEYPGILAWAVRGARDYLAALDRGHLVLACQPPGGAAQVESMLLENDPIRRFLAEQCTKDAAGTVGTLTLHNALSVWWTEEGLPAKRLPSAKAVKGRLADLGIETGRKIEAGSKIHAFYGIRMNE